MIKRNKSILATALLSIVSTGVSAKIYTDQIVFDQLGYNVCRDGYRPLDHYEAETNKNYLLDRMEQYQIVGLLGTWVIRGKGYRDNIIEDRPYGKTWCYPIEDISKIPTLSKNQSPKAPKLTFNTA